MKSIPLTQGKVALVDDEDFLIFSAFKWSYAKAGAVGYAYRKIGKKGVYLHREIMGALDHEKVDHKDGNSLDCRRGNMRICTQQQNLANRAKTSNRCSSRFKGVCWNKEKNRWQVDCQGKNVGRFKNEDDAALAYNFHALANFGEFARLNAAVL